MQPVAWTLLAVALALVALTHGQLRALRPSFLAPQFAWRRSAFDAIVARWTAPQRAAYRFWLRVDFVTLACYGGFGWLWSNGVGAAGWCAFALPAAATADAVENVLHLRLTGPDRSSAGDAPYRIAGAASALKFGLVAAFVLGAVSGR